MLPGGEHRAGTNVKRLLLVRLWGRGVWIGHTTRISVRLSRARLGVWSVLNSPYATPALTLSAISGVMRRGWVYRAAYSRLSLAAGAPAATQVDVYSWPSEGGLPNEEHRRRRFC